MMTSIDFSPLFRSSIGFDRVFDMLESANRLRTVDNWPPYDIIKTGEDAYRVTLALPGFGQNEIEVTHEPNLLVIKGAKSGDAQAEYLHRGIDGRAFERRFELADHMKVTAASLHDGLLTVDLVRELPEAMKPRRIEVRLDAPGVRAAQQPERLESRQAA